MRGRIECVGGGVNRIGGDPVGKISDVGFDVRQVVRWPAAFVDIPAFHGGVDGGLVVVSHLGFGRVTRICDPRHDDGSNDAQDGHHGEQFKQRKTAFLSSSVISHV